MTGNAELIVHGPPGSAPPVLAAAFLAGLAEAGIDHRTFHLVDCGGDPGVDAMRRLLDRPGDPNLVSTCTPVFLQAPLLRGMALTHRALTPLARLVSDHFFLVARAGGRWQDAASLIADLPRRRTRTGGYFKGGINHLLALSIAEAAGADVEFVVTASEPAVWDALADGRIDWACGVGAELRPHLDRGAIEVLAALGPDRLQPFQHVPTLAAFGLPVSFTMWRGLIGPPGLSARQQAAWHETAAAVVATQAWQDYLRRNGQVAAFLPGDAFHAFLEQEWTWYERHLGLAGLLPVKP